MPNAGETPLLQLVLPIDLVSIVLKQLHDHVASGGHLGPEKTLSKVRVRFYWVGQRKDIERWCQTCTKCASRKSPIPTRRAPLSLVPCSFPFQRVAMDILGPLPQTPRSNRYILVISDYFSKWVEAFPMENMEALTVAKILVNEFITRFGVPEVIHTDQGRNFESTLIKDLCSLLGIEKSRTSPYHPQSDGLVERFNRTLLNMLCTAANNHGQDWDVMLPNLLMAYRSSVHATTKFTPFQMLFGRQIKLPVDLMFGTPETEGITCQSQYVNDLRLRLENCYRMARENISLEQLRQKSQYDKKQAGSVFQIGDLVWLYNPVKKTNRGSRKLYRPWQGPFKIIEIVNEVTYRVQQVSRPHRKSVVHFDRLKPFHSRDGPTNNSPEEPSLDTSQPDKRVLDRTERSTGTKCSVNDEDFLIVTSERNSLEENSVLDPLIIHDETDSLQEANDSSVRRSSRQRNPPDRYGEFLPSDIVIS